MMKINKKHKKEAFDFKREYQISWNYIRESKNFIQGIIIIFILFALIGFLVPAPEILSDYIQKMIEELIQKTQGMSTIGLINFIFFNNLKSSFFGVVFGIFFGILPIVFAVFNGYIIGFVALMAVKEGGFLILWRILPHGIFELPAVFISLGLGLKLGTFIFQREKIKSFKEFLLNSLRVFLLIVLPLLIIAAIIEGILIAFAS